MTDRPRPPVNPGDPYVMHPSADPADRLIPRLRSTGQHPEGDPPEFGRLIGGVIASVFGLCACAVLIAATVWTVEALL